MIPILAHVAYLAISASLTVWVGRTLYRGGRVFLVDTFEGNETLADSVNRLLVVGFYLVNFGYVSLATRLFPRPETDIEAVELVATKVGIVLLVLGAMHFLNLFVFSRMRRRAMLRLSSPPVGPSEQIRWQPEGA